MSSLVRELSNLRAHNRPGPQAPVPAAQSFESSEEPNLEPESRTGDGTATTTQTDAQLPRPGAEDPPTNATAGTTGFVANAVGPTSAGSVAVAIPAVEGPMPPFPPPAALGIVPPSSALVPSPASVSLANAKPRGILATMGLPPPPVPPPPPPAVNSQQQYSTSSSAKGKVSQTTHLPPEAGPSSVPSMTVEQAAKLLAQEPVKPRRARTAYTAFVQENLVHLRQVKQSCEFFRACRTGSRDPLSSYAHADFLTLTSGEPRTRSDGLYERAG